MCLSKPKTPEPPSAVEYTAPPAPEPPVVAAEAPRPPNVGDSLAARSADKRRRRAAGGGSRLSTILTSGRGAPGTAATGAKTLLGQ